MLGIAFSERPTDVAEAATGQPVAVARANALAKALAAAPRDGELALGVDTLVALDDAIHGKPPDEAAARASLRALAGRTHVVVSGLALVRDGASPRTATATTRVTMRPSDEALLDWYVATGEWRERAGGYAIQGRGSALVTAIEGDYTNVVGLPVATLLALEPGLLTAAV